jgi:UDP-N-acetylmuramate--alanine ligase
LPLEGNNCAVNEHAVYKAFNVRVEGNGSCFFDVQTPSVMQDLHFDFQESIIL